MTGNAKRKVNRDSEALVIFSGRTDIGWLRCLKAGYRHCFVAVRTPRQWFIYNPLSHRTEIEIFGDMEPSHVAGHFALEGCTSVPWTVPDVPRRCLLPAPFTCVEAVKRVIGIRNPWVLTPWQLYRYLIANNQPTATGSS